MGALSPYAFTRTDCALTYPLSQRLPMPSDSVAKWDESALCFLELCTVLLSLSVFLCLRSPSSRRSAFSVICNHFTICARWRSASVCEPKWHSLRFSLSLRGAKGTKCLRTRDRPHQAKSRPFSVHFRVAPSLWVSVRMSAQ